MVTFLSVMLVLTSIGMIVLVLLLVSIVVAACAGSSGGVAATAGAAGAPADNGGGLQGGGSAQEGESGQQAPQPAASAGPGQPEVGWHWSRRKDLFLRDFCGRPARPCGRATTAEAHGRQFPRPARTRRS